jgi:hypothetical protein
VRYRTLETNIRAHLPQTRLAEARSVIGEDIPVTLRSRGNDGCRQVGTQQLCEFISRNGLMEVKALTLSTVLRLQRY